MLAELAQSPQYWLRLTAEESDYIPLLGFDNSRLLEAERAARAEALVYRWSLRGFAGRVAGLVLPDEGRGELRTESANGSHRSELEITSPKSKGDEYFLYGSETRPDGSGVGWCRR